MLKRLISLLILFYSTTSIGSSLSITWYGTSCMLIGDGKTNLMFDPYLTRPGLWNFISMKEYPSDPKIVKKWISETEMKKINGIFVSHTHFDHVLDMNTIQRLSGSMIYGSPSTLNIAKGGNIPREKLKLTLVSDKIQIGEFKITILAGKHPSHVFNYTFAKEPIKKPLKDPSPLHEYGMGRVYTYLIEHPRGSILFHPSAIFNWKNTKAGLKPVDLVIQGVANRVSTQDIVEKVIFPLKPKVIIPVHFDNFFKPLSEGVSPFFNANMDEFYQTLSKMYSTAKIPRLEYGKPYLFKKK